MDKSDRGWSFHKCNWRNLLKKRFNISISQPHIGCGIYIQLSRDCKRNGDYFELKFTPNKNLDDEEHDFPCKNSNIFFHSGIAKEEILDKPKHHRHNSHFCEHVLVIDKIKSRGVMQLLEQNFTEHNYLNYSLFFSHGTFFVFSFIIIASYIYS